MTRMRWVALWVAIAGFETIALARAPGLAVFTARSPAAALAADAPAARGCPESTATRVLVATCPPYNVKGDGIADDEPALQAILDAQLAMADDGIMTTQPRILLPCGTYRIGRPLRIKKGKTQLIGSGDLCTTITAHPKFVYGPLLVAYPASTHARVTTHAPLVAGPGGSYELSSAHFLSLRDVPTMDLNGLRAFTVEFFFKASSQTGNDSIISSSGSRYRADDAGVGGLNGTAFWVETAGGPFRARVRSDAETAQITGTTTPAIGRLYHVALSWDGTTARLFINGLQEAAQPLRGALLQRPWEDVVLGPRIARWPEATFGPIMATVLVDSVRISDTARYTSTFAAPSAKFSNDRHTLMLLNFDNQYDAFTIGNTKDGDAHLFLRDGNPANIGPNADLVIRDLQLVGGNHPGAFLTYAVKSRLEYVRVLSDVYGIFCWNNCFESRWIRPHVQMGITGRFGIANVSQGGVFELDFPVFIGGAILFVQGGADATLIRPWFQTEINTYTAVLAYGDALTLVSPTINVETGAPLLTEGMILNAVTLVSVNGGYLETHNSAPFVRVDGGGSINFFSTRFVDQSAAPAPSVFSVYAAASHPVNAVGVSRASATRLPPWSDTANALLIIESGALTLPAQSDPVSPSAGQLWRSITSNTLKYYDGSTTRSLADTSHPQTPSNRTLSTTQPTIVGGKGIGLTVNETGQVARAIYKVTALHAAFAAAATTADQILATLPARTQLQRIYVDVTATFGGGGATAATMTCGKSAGGHEYLTAFDVFTAPITRGLTDSDLGPSINRANAVQGGDLPSWSGATAVQCRLTTRSAPTSALTRGALTLYLVTEAVP